MMRLVESSLGGTLTFLFTDLEGSTRLWEQFPVAMKDALGRHDAILREAIEASGGHVVKTTGDGAMAVFPNPTDGVVAGIAVQRALGTAWWPETGPLRVRMGLHAGQADQRAGDYFGPTVNRTARIMAAGHGGQILLSASAASLAADHLPPGADLLDLGEHRLKDLGRAEHVFQLVHPDLPSTFPPLATLRRDTGNLPARTAPFVGRQVEYEAVRTRLEDPAIRLLTLTGPGGTGKTTLAIRVAEDLASSYPDGVAFVDLSSTRDSDAVAIAVARAIGLGEVLERPLQEELTNRLRDQRMLLILDNLEQVTAVAGLVAQWLRDCPAVKVLVTSREALHVRAEHVYQVPPLGLPPAGTATISADHLERFEAVQLFVDRARAVRSDFRLTDENAAAVAEICRRLDGLPLAIELAAARLRFFSPEALRDRLDDRLRLLSSGPRDLPERQQTLRATIDWSFNLLDEAEQRTFALLSVFSDAAVSTVETVALGIEPTDTGGPGILDRLAGLIEKSLVRQIDGGADEPRVRMLETIREYAAEHLAQQPEFSRQAHHAHGEFFATFAGDLRRDLIGNQCETALATLSAEIDNLRIAWRYWVAEGDLEQLDKLAESLLILYDARSWYHDTVTLTTDMLAALAGAALSPDRAGQEIGLRISLARALMATRGFTPEVEDALAGALELFEQSTDARQQFSVLRGLASLYEFRGQFDQTAVLGRQLLEFAEREGDPRMLIDGHLVVGTTLMFIDDLQGGLDHLDRAIALFPRVPVRARSARVGNDPRVACLTTSALTLWLMGFPNRAVERVNSALALAAELDHPFTLAFARFHAALLHFWRRDWDIALARTESLLDVSDEYGFQIWTAAGTCLLGAVHLGLGRQEGLATIGEGMNLYQGMRSPPVFWPMLLFMQADASHRAGQSAAGLAPIDTAIQYMSTGLGTTILPELLLLKGDLVATLTPDGEDPPGAEHWYRSAMERAAKLGVRISELRAMTRLCRIRDGQPGADADVAALGRVYAQFTEGFDTLDLIEARAALVAAGQPPAA